MLGSGDESCRAALGLRAGAPVARPRPRVSRCSVCARSVVRRSGASWPGAAPRAMGFSAGLLALPDTTRDTMDGPRAAVPAVGSVAVSTTAALGGSAVARLPGALRTQRLAAARSARRPLPAGGPARRRWPERGPVATRGPVADRRPARGRRRGRAAVAGRPGGRVSVAARREGRAAVAGQPGGRAAGWPGGRAGVAGRPGGRAAVAGRPRGWVAVAGRRPALPPDLPERSDSPTPWRPQGTHHTPSRGRRTPQSPPFDSTAPLFVRRGSMW